MSIAKTLGFILSHPLNRRAPLKALGRYVRWQIGSRIAPGPVIVDFVAPMRLVATHGMPGATLNIYCDLHEYEEMAFTLHLLRKGDLFVDVGSNIGSYTVLACAAGADAIAFEPGERYQDLVRNIAINDLKAVAHRAAVGAESGILRFTVGLDCINRAALDGERFVEVPVVRLDDVITRPPTLIKVDVEGFENAVLAGGAKTFAGATAVIMEINGQTSRYGQGDATILDQMQAWGFRRVSYDPVRRELGVQAAGANVIFVRGDIADRLKTAPKFKTKNHLI